MAERNIGLVYGGAAVGLMGAVADAAMAAGGEVIGVIPRSLVEREVAHKGLPDLRIVGSMHERKALMAELSDAFIALPGGIGTLEELFEVWTWTQLGAHAKPCALLNVLGFYDKLLAFLDHVVENRFSSRSIGKCCCRRVPPLICWIEFALTECRQRRNGSVGLSANDYLGRGGNLTQNPILSGSAYFAAQKLQT